jgi:hypothetical protein
MSLDPAVSGAAPTGVAIVNMAPISVSAGASIRVSFM